LILPPATEKQNFGLFFQSDEYFLRKAGSAHIWGLDQGINVGDGLFALAHLALHRLSDRGVPPGRQQAATSVLDRACLALCEGQFFDMTFEDLLTVDLDQYIWMIRRKTAALLAAATQIGAILATDDALLIERFREFGEHLGLAFQIQDDLLEK